jgi:signal transduction histidine kinase
VMEKLGWSRLPVPVTEAVQFPTPGGREGRWAELKGVVRGVNSDGTMSLQGTREFVYLWLGQSPSNRLSQYIDAKLSVRGVLLLSLLDAPLLLIPSPAFVDVEESTPKNPFAIPVREIADLVPDLMGAAWTHRTRVEGEVTYRDCRSFFVQDASGGIRVLPASPANAGIGDTVEVVGFCAARGPVRVLTDALLRVANPHPPLAPRRLDLGEALSFRQNGLLVYANAIVLTQRTNAAGQALELQEQQRIFSATLSPARGNLPRIAPGARVRVTGVLDNETGALPVGGKAPEEGPSVGALNICLRSPADVAVLSGPPWWTWKRAVALVGALLTVLIGAFLWVHLLRRRLERQQAVQIAFSQQILRSLENERRRIAVNLHDGLGQTLLAIKNQALVTMQRSPEEPGLRQRLEDISGATSQAIEEVRQITHDLRPYQLDRLGLTQAIRATVSRAAANTRMLIASRVDDIDSVFDKDSEIHVYRIVQEAVNNVIKHSGASEAAVVVKRLPRIISLSIRDNGRGFDAGTDPSARLHDLGYGLSGIAERVRILEGTLGVDAKPGEGTSLAIEVPLPIRAHDARSNSSDRG